MRAVRSICRRRTKLFPRDWRPTSGKEFQNCLELILGLFDRVFEHGSPDMHQKAWTILATHLRSLLSYGMLPRLKEVVQRRSIPDSCLPDVLQSLDDFLHYECGGQRGSIADNSTCREAAEWLRALTPSDFSGRLKAVVGKVPWHHSMRQGLSGIPSEIIPLAEELNRDPEKFETVLPYLNSPDAASAGLFGDAMARLDANAKFMDRILSMAIKSGSNALARGYIGRLVTTYPASAERLNTWLDRLEKEAPEAGLLLAIRSPAPEFSRPIERTLRLIRAKKLPVQSLQNFIVGVLLDRMTSDELSTVLDMLVQAGDPQSLHVAVDFVGQSIQNGRRSDRVERDAMWRVLEASAPIEDRADYWWARAVETFVPEAPERACSVAILALIGKDHEKHDQAWSILSSSWQRRRPDLVMESVGKVLLNPEHGWRLRIGARSGLFQALPLNSVQRWLAPDRNRRRTVDCESSAAPRRLMVKGSHSSIHLLNTCLQLGAKMKTCLGVFPPLHTISRCIQAISHRHTEKRQS